MFPQETKIKGLVIFLFVIKYYSTEIKNPKPKCGSSKMLVAFKLLSIWGSSLPPPHPILEVEPRALSARQFFLSFVSVDITHMGKMVS